MSSITPSELPTVLTAIPTVAEMNKDPIKKFTLFPKLSSELRLTIWEFALESRIIRATATHFTSEKFVRNPGMVALQLEVVKHQYGIKRVCVESSRVFDKDSASEGDKAPGVTTYSGLNFKGNKDLLLVATSQALGMLWQTDCPKQGFIQYTKTQFAGLERVGFNCHADIFETAHNHADLITTLAQFGDLKTLMFFIDQEGDLCDLGSEDELACLYRLDEKLALTFDAEYAASHARFTLAIRWFKGALRLFKETKFPALVYPEIKFMALRSKMGAEHKVELSGGKVKGARRIVCKGLEHWNAGILS